MASRSNDAGKDKAANVKTYGDSPGYQAPTSGNRPVAAPASREAVRAAMRADTGTTRPMPAAPVKRYGANMMPLAARDNAPTGIGGAAREKKIMSMVDKATR